MSHFCVLVLAPGDTPEAEVEMIVAELLEPYRESETCFEDGTRWDWYQIGGRWTGALDPSYNPETDSVNVETCPQCGGTGHRDDFLGQRARERDSSYTCNGCGGEGSRVKWPTQWKRFKGDMRPANEVPVDFTPYALVTPDGRWHERARMGWFGVTIENEDGEEEQPIEEWKTTVQALLGEHIDTIAVVVDCHV